MPQTPLTVNDDRPPRPQQEISDFRLSPQEMIDLLSMYDPYGVWRMDLESGSVHWSRDVFEIHGLEYSDGPVDLNAALAAYHPDDAKIVAQLLDETIEKKSGFRFVLRLKQSNGRYKMVKSTCRYRQNQDGSEELYGLFSEFQLPIRNIAAYGQYG